MSEITTHFFHTTNSLVKKLEYLSNNVQKKYDYYMYDIEDPRIKNWYLISSPVPTVLALVTYLFLIFKVLPKYMNNRKPFKLDLIIQLYNVFQIVACSVLVYQLVTPRLFVWKCERFTYSEDPLSMKRVNLGYYFYLIKLAELFETGFFVLRKKFNQVSFLHVYHHLTTFLMAWFYGKYFSGGMVAFCMFLNSSIHIIMYSYYFLSSLGRKWQKYVKRWKSTITTLQMSQLATLIVHSSQVVFNKQCGMPNICFYFYATNVTVVFYMFKKFYEDNYRMHTKEKV